MQKKESSLHNHLRNLIIYTTKIWKSFLIIVGLYTGFFFANFFLPEVLDKDANDAIQKEDFNKLPKAYRALNLAIRNPEIHYKRSELSDPRLFWHATVFTIKNNFLAEMTYVYGGFVFGIPPIVHAILQGSFAGNILRNGGWQNLKKRILPHGIVELPNMIIGMSLGLSFGLIPIRAIRQRKLKELLNALKIGTIYVLASIPILLIAAFLECYGTRFLWGQ